MILLVHEICSAILALYDCIAPVFWCVCVYNRCVVFKLSEMINLRPFSMTSGNEDLDCGVTLGNLLGAKGGHLSSGAGLWTPLGDFCRLGLVLTDVHETTNHTFWRQCGHPVYKHL